MIKDKDFLMMFRLSEPELYSEMGNKFKDIIDTTGELLIGHHEFLGLIHDDTPNEDGDIHGYEYEGKRYFAVTIYWQKIRSYSTYISMPWVVSLCCDPAYRRGFMVKHFQSREDAIAYLDPIDSLSDPYERGFLRV